MYTGGPAAAFANWTMVGGLSFVVSLSMAEIAAALPTAGGIYYWAYRLGGKNNRGAKASYSERFSVKTTLYACCILSHYA
jgi:amino acid transporter